MNFLSSDEPFLVKSAGGAASQMITLQNAIKVSQVTNRRFTIAHFPYSTGAYWPMAIESLLHPNEIPFEIGKTRGLQDVDRTLLKIGLPIPNHPLSKKILSYERALHIARVLKIYKYLDSIKTNLTLGYDIRFSSRRIEQVPGYVKYLKGGYVPHDDADVHYELQSRFLVSGLVSPYQIDNNYENVIVLHYRLGDKRLSFKHPEFQSGGIIDPISFESLIENLPKLTIKIVSDEPEAALKILRRKKINATAGTSGNNLWKDLQVMTSSRVLICTWSTVSLLAASIRAFLGKPTFFPSNDYTTNTRVNWHLKNVTLYDPVFLKASDEVYAEKLEHPNFRNEVYKKNYSD